MARVPPKGLPTTSYLVLGLLSFGRELTGYELKRWADGSVRFFYAAPAMSQIYAELGRLEAEGLVRARDDSGGAARARTVYAITAKGRRRLQRWLADAPFEPPTLKHTTALRLFLGHLVDGDRLVELLEAHRAWADRMLDELAEVRRSLGDDPRWANADQVARWGERVFGAERDGAGEALERARPQPSGAAPPEAAPVRAAGPGARRTRPGPTRRARTGSPGQPDGR
jgi:DNA-binding PadR family transcriptional regulator